MVAKFAPTFLRKTRAKSLIVYSRCTIELAFRFAERGFWGDEDAQLVVHWVLDLQKIGYEKNCNVRCHTIRMRF